MAAPTNERKGREQDSQSGCAETPSVLSRPAREADAAPRGGKGTVRLLNSEMRQDGGGGLRRGHRHGPGRERAPGGAGARHGPGYDPFGTVSSSISSSPSSDGPERTRQSFRAAAADVAVPFPTPLQKSNNVNV